MVSAEEKEKLLNSVKRREEELKREQEAKTDLMEKIKVYESKLLTGGKDIVDHTYEQQQKLEERR